MMKKMIWFVFILLSLFMGWQEKILIYSTPQHYTMAGLETSGRSRAKVILNAWNSHSYGDVRMTGLAESITHWDFLFILCYVLLILAESSDQMQQEEWLILNNLLRFNLLLAVLAGLLDIYENNLLLHNFRHVADEQYYLRTFWVSYPKFIFAGWAVLVWLASVVKSKFNQANA